MHFHSINTKIAFVAQEFGLYHSHGGIASYLFQLVKYITENLPEYEIHVIADTYDKECYLIKEKKIKFYKYTFCQNIKSNHYGEICQILKTINPDIVECSDWLGLCSLAILEKHLGLAFQKTTFVTNHHSSTQKLFISQNKMDFKYAGSFDKINNLMESIQFKLSDLNVAPSSPMSAYVQKTYKLSDKVQTIPLPYQNVLRTKSKIIEDLSKSVEFNGIGEFNICLISRIDTIKGQDILVSEFAKLLEKYHINAKLYLVGGSNVDTDTLEPIRQKIYEKIDKSYKDNIHFFDFMNLQEQEKIIAIADLIILPSLVENFSVAMIECVLRDLPIMTSKYAGSIDYMSAHIDYMTFDPYNENELCDKIYHFYQLSKKERNIVAQKQKEHLLKLISPENSIIKRLNIYKSINSFSCNDNVCVNICCSPDSELNINDSGIKLIEKIKNASCNLLYVPQNASKEELNFFTSLKLSSKLHGCILALGNLFIVNKDEIIQNNINLIFSNITKEDICPSLSIKENLLSLFLKSENVIIYSANLNNSFHKISNQNIKLYHQLQNSDWKEKLI